MKQLEQKYFIKWRKEQHLNKIVGDSFLCLITCQGGQYAKSMEMCWTTCNNACDSNMYGMTESAIITTFIFQCC